MTNGPIGSLCIGPDQQNRKATQPSKPIYYINNPQKAGKHIVWEVTPTSGRTDSTETPLGLGSDTQMNISPPL